MSNKVTFDDLMAEVEQSYKAVEFEGPNGEVFHFRAVAVLPRHERKAVTDAVKVVNSKKTDVDAQESAIDDVLLAVVDNAEGLSAVLDILPLGAKAKLIQLWSEGTQAPEA
ncbi:phage tail assembly protein [Streptomyces erythrochromogenes]|uniref:phage tail assembly protein n=1 Tax=Streptomyces erythrochromogenes TaxID=285574 RepID=UPI0037CD945F